MGVRKAWQVDTAKALYRNNDGFWRSSTHVDTKLRHNGFRVCAAAERTPDLQLQRQQSNPIAATPRRRDRDDDTAGGTHSSPEARPHKHVSPSRRRPTPDPRLHPPQPIQWQAMDDGPTRRGPKPHQVRQLGHTVRQY
jgi:hypothetical protein